MAGKTTKKKHKGNKIHSVSANYAHHCSVSCLALVKLVKCLVLQVTPLAKKTEGSGSHIHLVVFFPRISGKAYSRVVLIDVMMKSYFAHVLGSSRH